MKEIKTIRVHTAGGKFVACYDVVEDAVEMYKAYMMKHTGKNNLKFEEVPAGNHKLVLDDNGNMEALVFTMNGFHYNTKLAFAKN